MPTAKRQRQKEGRRARLEARRKAQRRRQLIRRGAIIVIVAGAVVGSVVYITGPSGNSSATGTTTTTVVREVTEAQITAANKATSVLTREVDAARVKAANTSAEQARVNAIAVAAGCPASPKTRVNHLSWKSAPKMAISTTAHYAAIVRTTLGTFTISLYAKSAPITVNNFVFLARHGFYRCVVFHRVVPSFMDQTGDPTGTGSGGPGYTIPDELPERTSNSAYQYPPGGVAMANAGPDTGGSQFFLVTGFNGEGLGNTFTLFGRVTNGLSVVAKINGQGNWNPKRNGEPPQVINRILSVRIVHSR